jgi:hypothetical protein
VILPAINQANPKRGTEVKRDTRSVTLSVGAEAVFLPLVTAFIEKGANCFGLEMGEALRLTLAAEEVFMHLCRMVTAPGGPVQIICSDGGYYAQAVFSLPAEAFDLRAFNLTATISMEDDADLDSMGLVLASRSVDRFLLNREEGGSLQLALIKEKSYPALSESPPAVATPLTGATLRTPGPEELKFISQLAVSYYDAGMLSDILLHPGKLADMIAVGEYDSLAAVGTAGGIGGAIFWHRVEENTVECFGPYVFNQDPASDIPEELLEGCIGTVAKTQAVGIINTRPTPEFPKRHFELLGTLDAYAPDGSSARIETWFRLMCEDMGTTAWVHPEIEAFVRREYARLVLPRAIRIERPSGETLPPHSVISAEFDRLHGHVSLRPMWPGADAAENIERHVRLMKGEKILNINFVVDLGHAWQSVFVPGLLGSGFEPRFVVPYAGKGDVVVFQFGGQHE